VPWTVYSGRYTIAYLEKLGFDCLRDIIDHGHYDGLKEVENKIGEFTWTSLKTIEHLKSMNFDTLKERCTVAAYHNQKLLEQMKQQWSMDFVNWIDILPSQLQI
jgi:hypothetical protein